MNFWNSVVEVLIAPVRLIMNAPMALVNGPRKLLGLSLPARVALLATIVLLISATAVRWILLSDPRGVDYWVYWRDSAIIFLLTIAIGVVTYYVVRAWLEGSSSPYPDIDEAWRQGIAALAHNGIDISELPLYLVVGCPTAAQAKARAVASGLIYRVAGVPGGSAPLQWYANDNSIFLYCTNASVMSKLASLGVAGQQALPAPPGGGGGLNLHGTMVSNGPDLTRTMASEPTPFPQGMGNPSLATATAPRPAMDMHGTLVSTARQTFLPSSTGGGNAPKQNQLAGMDIQKEGDRLSYVCYLLQQSRAPYCPINGVLAELPYSLISRESYDMQVALDEDFSILSRKLQLRCPVVVVVSGMEAEEGFMELVRRVGFERARQQRYGKGMELWNDATVENMSALAGHACGAFEMTVHDMFREREGYNKPGNPKLYRLLCRVRAGLTTAVEDLLVHGLVPGKNDASAGKRFMVSGCYFAATGDTADKQAFLSGVFDKLMREENEVEWCDEVYRADQRYILMSRLLLLTSAFMGLGIIVFAFKLFAT